MAKEYDQDLLRGVHHGPRTPSQMYEMESAHTNLAWHIHQGQVEAPELKTMLDSIDFEEIQGIFNTHIRAETGNTEAIARMVPREKIIFLDRAGCAALGFPKGAQMSYDSTGGSIIIDVDNVRAKLKNFRGPPEVGFVNMLNHEQAHAVSSHYHREAKSGYAVSQVGVQQGITEHKGSKPQDHFMAFNEGITEKFARMVSREYFSSRIGKVEGLTQQHLDALEDVYADPNISYNYLCYVHLVNAIEEKFKVHFDLADSRIVWKSPLSAALSGLNLLDRRVAKMVKSLFGDNNTFFKDLAHYSLSDLEDLGDAEGGAAEMPVENFDANALIAKAKAHLDWTPSFLEFFVKYKLQYRKIDFGRRLLQLTS